MGKRLNVSQPMVMATQLVPLDDNIRIDATGLLNQWYYDNDGSYQPNREITPLLLTPTVTVYDQEAKTTSTATLHSVLWTALGEGQNGADLPISSTNTNDPYYISGSQLIVRKNIPVEKPVTIRCNIQYIDPRVSGKYYNIVDTVNLYTMRDSTIVYPQLNILTEEVLHFSPFIGKSGADYTAVTNTTDRNPNESGWYERSGSAGAYVYTPTTDTTPQVGKTYYTRSIFTLRAQALLNAEDISAGVYWEWQGRDGTYTTPVPIDELASDGYGKFPCYVEATQPTGKGQGTDTINIDAMYGDDLDIIVKARKPEKEITDTTNKSPVGQGWCERGAATYIYTEVQAGQKSPVANGWYEHYDEGYVLSSDTIGQQGKTYYRRFTRYAYTPSSDNTPVAGKTYYQVPGDYYPGSVYRHLAWDTPTPEIITGCRQGSKLTHVVKNMEFFNIINLNGKTMDDVEAARHLRYHWYTRLTNVGTPVDRGWGFTLTLPSSEMAEFLAAGNINTNVYADVYLLGPYRRVVQTNSITHEDKIVLARVVEDDE